MTIVQDNLALDDVWLPLHDAPPVTIGVTVDTTTTQAIEPFDYEWSGTSSFVGMVPPTLRDDDWSIGVIVGASGSGKSTLLRDFGTASAPTWGNGTIASHFATPDEAAARFYAVGLNAVPTWTKPYNVLSTGERFRADLARVLGSDVVVDEFTSVVDRHVAMSASKALRRYATANGLRRFTIATCHRDVLPWLQPDWIVDTDLRSWVWHPRECLQRTDVVVEIREAHPAVWELFHRHHYLSADLNKASNCYVATCDGVIAGFTAVLPFPNGNLRNAYREHRTVVLPDFQGMGLGMRLSDAIAAMYVAKGRRFFSRTAHPRMGLYRDASPLWRETSNSHVQQTTHRHYNMAGWTHDTARIAWSHEYMGDASAEPAPVIEDVEQLGLFAMTTAANIQPQRITDYDGMA